MFAIVAVILFVFEAFKFHPIDGVSMGWLGLAFLALHLVYDFRPWAGRVNA